MRLTWKLAASALAATAVLALASACGSSSSNSKTSTPGGASTNGASSATSAASATKGASGATPKATSSAISNAITDLEKSSDNFIKANYDITYNLTTTTGGKASNSTMVIKHKDNKDLISINGDIDGSGSNTSATIISDGTNSYICTDQQKTCLKTTSDQSGGIGQIFNAIKPDKLLEAIKSENGATVESTSGQTIAGRSAKCYKVTSSEGNGSICFDKSTDIMLSLQMTGGSDGDTKFVATKVGGTPSDGDFNPPYKVQDLSSGG